MNMPDIALLVSLTEGVTHKMAWTVQHAEEVNMAHGLTTEVK